MPDRTILVLNGGSSSVKFGLFDAATLAERGRGRADQLAAFLATADWPGALAAIGHRIVHGGAAHTAPERLDPPVLADLRAAVPLAPDHLPGELSAVDLCAERLPGVPQFACYDTWFHRTLPPVARLLPIPRWLADRGVRRFGFHGVSYEWIAGRLAAIDPERAGGRAVVAHLGGGASLAALDRGVCLDTTMGFTPAGGLVMGTRPGDLDPGVLLWLLREERLGSDALDHLLNKESGLVGLAGEADMRALLARDDADARHAVALFCRRASQGIAAMAASLGGIDTLVFTGGIGEHLAAIRVAIVAPLGFLGVALDVGRNQAHAALASADGAPVAVRVIPTDEERQVAGHVRALLGAQSLPEQ